MSAQTKPSFTTHLLSLHPDLQTAATQHAFLAAAGTGTLDARPLESWLCQDKYYQCAYVGFMGRLISKIDLAAHAWHFRDSKDSLNFSTFHKLLDALNAIKDEIGFYESVANDYGIEIPDDSPNQVTEKYVALFADSTGPERGVLHGLTTLWATEYVYLQAWSYAKRQTRDTNVGNGNLARALYEKFIPNWTCEPFKKMVQDLALLTDRWASEADEELKSECETIWKIVLELERAFWPAV